MSTVPAVKLALFNLLTSTLTDAQIIYGPWDAVTTTKSRIVTVGKVTNATRALDSLGIGTTEERYTVDLAFSVDLAGAGSLSTAVGLVFDDYTAAEIAIREYSGGPDLGLAAQGVLNAVMTGAWELDEQTDPDGSHAAIKSSVAVIAQNT